jgi:uncharacterized membrane protein YiaA
MGLRVNNSPAYEIGEKRYYSQLFSLAVLVNIGLRKSSDLVEVSDIDGIFGKVCNSSFATITLIILKPI